MSGTVFYKTDWTVQNLLAYVEQGDIGLPELQRPFVWPDTKVRDLFDSMYRGYPIGTLLFWENGLPDHGRTITAPAGNKVPKLLIVDGQQRITSLFAVMRGHPVVRKGGQKERIRIAFRPRDSRFEVCNAAIENDPEWIADISGLWSPNKKMVRAAFFQRLKSAKGLAPDEEDALDAALDRVENLALFPVWALVLSSSVSEEDAAQVFVRINSTGASLNQANFILTLMSVFWEAGRAELERFSAGCRTPASGQRPTPFNRIFQPDPDRLLRVPIALGFRRARLEHVYALLRGKDLETKVFSEERREQQFKVLEAAQRYALDLNHWHEFLNIVREAGFLRKDLVSSQYVLLYTYALFLIGSRDFKVDPYTLRRLMARWLFMASLTGRYTDSPESSMDQDLADLRRLSTPEDFVQHFDRTIENQFTEDFWTTTLPNELQTSAVRHPAFFAYIAALVLLDAQAFYSFQRVRDLLNPELKGKKSGLDKHHLFPKAYLSARGIKDRRELNQVANLALVEWKDNEIIKARPPSEYMPKLKARMPPDEDLRMRFWHALPDRWEEMDYHTFLEARRKMIADVIRAGFSKLKEGA